jgi:hypothetical protein
MFALPFVLTSSLALAQQKDEPKTEKQSKDQTKKKGQKPQTQTQTQTQDQKAKAEKAKKDATDTGQKTLQQKDEDLDMAIGEATTTAAEKRDVVESRAERRREVEGKRWNVAPLFGYATNDLNVGMGARGGYTFETPVYVGGTFLYHFGADTVAVAPGVRTETSTSFYYPGIEAGYDIGIGPVLVRPYGGAALLFGRTSTTINAISGSDTSTSLMLYPGVTAQYIFPDSPVFVGGDTRVLLPLENVKPAFSLLATAGLTL